MSAPHLSTFAKLAPLAGQQWGLFTSKQATAVGVPAVILSRWAEQGALLRLAQGIYKVAGTPPDARDGLRTAWLGLDPDRSATERLTDSDVDAVVSHWSAAAVHGLGDLHTDVHEFTVHGRRQTRRPDVRIHTRTTALNPAQWTLVDGLPVTSIPCTLAELAASSAAGPHLAGVVRDAFAAPAADRAGLTSALAPYAARYKLTQGDGVALVQFLLAAGDPQSKSRSARLEAQVDWLVATFSPEVLRTAVALLGGEKSSRSKVGDVRGSA